MDCATALQILRAHESDLRSRGVRHVGLFGSTARGEAGPDSDVDLLIEIDEDRVRDVYAYVAVVQFIEGLYPRRVDVANRAALKAEVRPHALRDVIDAF